MSGGIDSATAAALLVSEGWTVSALFVDYEQAAVSSERRASHAIADRYLLEWSEVHLHDFGIASSGEIRGRNDLLIAICLAVSSSSSVAIGTHSGSQYLDCSEPHAKAWQDLLDAEYRGSRRLISPFIGISKVAVVALARDLGVPLELTHSCDSAPDPCGSCVSCLERASVLAGS